MLYEDTIDGKTEKGMWAMDPTNILKGDLNLDNKLDKEDLTILDKYLLADIKDGKKAEFNKTLFIIADMNDDENVDSFDLIALRKAVIKFASKEKKNP